MIAVRTYCTPETALVNCVYYHKYSQHRCNLALDTDLDVGVYGYTDAETTLAAISDGQTSTCQVVLGVLAGYLHKSQKKKGLKVSLDPRSCKLFGFFVEGCDPLLETTRCLHLGKSMCRLSNNHVSNSGKLPSS